MRASASRELARLFVVPLVIVLGIVLTAAFTVFYSMTLRLPDGGVVSSRWPMEFTLSFSQYLVEGEGSGAGSGEAGGHEVEGGEAEGGGVTDVGAVGGSDTGLDLGIGGGSGENSGSEADLTLVETGKALLDADDLWLQVLREDGTELMSYAKPEGTPGAYTPSELLQVFQSGDGHYSVFVSTLEGATASYTYLIGFPLSISKVVMYVDNARYDTGKVLSVAVVVATLLLLIVLMVFYAVTFSRNLSAIRASLLDVSKRCYTPAKKRAFLRDVYEGIDQLDKDLALADDQRERDEQAREEWLANITHDLKTPLAPIRGYAELLAEDVEETLPPQQVQRYGQVILKNSLYAEELVDELKLAYQLQSDMVPLEKKRQDLVRFVREVVIDILNSPGYEERDLELVIECGEADSSCAFDAPLLRRALVNIIANALKHNGPETVTRVVVGCDEAGWVRILVSDDGAGMTPQEVAGLFERYYRGTSTETNTEGSGLGMAIARQIIEAHEGTIEVESAAGSGTTVTVSLPR